MIVFETLDPALPITDGRAFVAWVQSRAAMDELMVLRPHMHKRNAARQSDQVDPAVVGQIFGLPIFIADKVQWARFLLREEFQTVQLNDGITYIELEPRAEDTYPGS